MQVGDRVRLLSEAGNASRGEVGKVIGFYRGRDESRDEALVALLGRNLRVPVAALEVIRTEDAPV